MVTEDTELEVAPRKKIDALSTPRALSFRKMRTPSHNKNRTAGQSNTTTTIRFLFFCPTCPLFYNSFVLWPSEDENLNTSRFISIGLLLR